MATVLTCGFECGTEKAAAHVVAGAGTRTFDTTIKRTGTYSLKVAAAGAAAYGQIQFTSAAVTVIRLYVRVPTLAADAQLLALTGSAFNAYLGYENSTGKLRVWGQSNFAGRQVGPVVSAGTWYAIDMVANATAGTIDWKVDGAAQTQATMTTGGGYTALSMGQVDNTDHAYATYDGYYDDVLIGNASGDFPLTHDTVRVFVPSADGTHNTGTAGNFTNAAATNITNATTDAYTYLDEIPPTTTDRVEQRLNTAGTVYVEVRFNSTTETQTPIAVDALGCWRAATAASAAGQAKLRDNLGSTDDAVVNTTIAVTTDTYWRKHYAARPAALGAWTTAALNDLRARVGFGTDVTPYIWFGGILVEVAFPAAATSDWPGRVAPTVILQAVSRAGSW